MRPRRRGGTPRGARRDPNDGLGADATSSAAPCGRARRRARAPAGAPGSAPAPLAARECGREVVERVPVAAEPPHGDVALEDLAEADEQAGPDQPRDLAVPGGVPPELEQAPLQQPGEADVVGDMLDLGRLAL